MPRKTVRAAIALLLCLGLTGLPFGCARNVKLGPYPLDREAISKKPTGAPHMKDGTCVREYEVTEEVTQQYRYRTDNLSEDIVSALVAWGTGLVSIFGLFPNERSDAWAAVWLLGGLALFPVGTVFLGHGLFVSLTKPADITQKGNETTVVTESATGCGTDSGVAATGEDAGEAAEEAASDDEGEAEHASAPSTKSGEGSGDVEARLKKLERLHDKGLVTDEEYEAKKEEILDSL